MQTRSREQETELNDMLATVAELQKKKAELEEATAAVQQEINHLCQVAIPEFCEDTGGAPRGFLADGTAWDVEKKYSVSQPKETKSAFHQWLDENGFKNLIKRTASADLGKMDADQFEHFQRAAKEAGYSVDQETKVAPATCKKWVVDRIKARLPVPDHLVSVRTWYQVNFKEAK